MQLMTIWHSCDASWQLSEQIVQCLARGSYCISVWHVLCPSPSRYYAHQYAGVSSHADPVFQEAQDQAAALLEQQQQYQAVQDQLLGDLR